MNKLESILSLCRRTGKLVIGYDRIKSGRVRAELIVLASDASERTKSHSAAFTADGGKVFQTDLTMERLGSLLGAGKVAVFAVTEKGLAGLVTEAFGSFEGNS